MTLEFHSPSQFFFHHSRAKRRINLFVNHVCYAVDRVVSYAPLDIKDVPASHLTISCGFSNKVEINEDTAVIY